MNGFNYIKPIIYVDEECESEHLSSLKQRIIQIVDNYNKSNNATASIYLREYNFNEWITVNGDEKYKPGSLFKVPLLIGILKINEDNPGFLNKRLTFDKPFGLNRKVLYTSKSIQLGKTYTVSELLKYMIKYSDNNATALLESNIDLKVIQKLFSDIGLEVPNLYADNYFFTPREYSLFMHTIYNAGYLTIKDSEYAAALLNECEFKDGIAKGIPDNIKLAHKFGEEGDQNEKQLHESAIVYLNKNPYLLTVMTKGKDYAKLSQLIGEISSAVYSEMLNEINNI